MMDPSKPFELTQLTVPETWTSTEMLLIVGIAVAATCMTVAGVLIGGKARNKKHAVNDGHLTDDDVRVAAALGVAAVVCSLLGTPLTLIIIDEVTGTADRGYVANQEQVATWATERYGIKVDRSDVDGLKATGRREDDSDEGVFDAASGPGHIEFMLDDGTVVSSKIVDDRMIFVKSGDANELPVVTKTKD